VLFWLSRSSVNVHIDATLTMAIVWSVGVRHAASTCKINTVKNGMIERRSIIIPLLWVGILINLGVLEASIPSEGLRGRTNLGNERITMQLFRDDRGTLQPVEKDSFKLERDIQLLVEANMETLFGLEFVSSEFSIAKFRLDSLAYDEPSNSFVIVEYKRGHSYSVIDQGYSYLSVMLNNKAEFILEYNEKTGKELKRSDVDWSSSKVIFVSPSFNSYQKTSLNFRGMPFELWEIRKFSGGLVALEQYIPSATDSIDKVAAGPNSIIKRVTSEVTIGSEEQLVSVLSQDLAEVWEEFKSRLLDLPGTSLYATKTYMSIKLDEATLAKIRFQRKDLSCELARGNVHSDAEISSGVFALDDPKSLAEVKEWSLRPKVRASVYVFRVRSLRELEYALFLVKQKYEQMS
jgi:hypothetical protein